MLNEVITARKALVGDAITVRHRAGVFGRAQAVNGGLVALEVGEAGEVCRGGAGGDGAGPGSES